jgi:uncharacterized protein
MLPGDDAPRQPIMEMGCREVEAAGHMPAWFADSVRRGDVKMSLSRFEVPFGECLLRGDRFALRCETLVLHGAGNSSRARFWRLRQSLNGCGIPSASFDFVGQGETGGAMQGCTLRGRTEQAAAVVRHACTEPLTLIASSMGAYTAMKLTEMFAVDHLVLLVPAVYTPCSYDAAFGPEFSAAIRRPGSWQDSDAFDILSRFKGCLLVIAAESDDVIPRAVVEQIHASAKNAEVRLLHVVPASSHLSLFPDERDLLFVLRMIVEVCGRRRDRNRCAGDHFV